MKIIIIIYKSNKHFSETGRRGTDEAKVVCLIKVIPN